MSERDVTMSGEEWRWVLEDLDPLDAVARKIRKQLPSTPRDDEEYTVCLTVTEAAEIGEFE